MTDHSAYHISLNPSDLQLDVIHGFLARSYWRLGVRKEVIEKAARNSLTVGSYLHDGPQVGFARLVTDYATFGYLADVFVLESHRGKGLASAMVRALMELPEVRELQRILLATRDAQGVYSRLGFERLKGEGNFMQISRAKTPPAPALPALPAFSLVRFEGFVPRQAAQSEPSSGLWPLGTLTEAFCRMLNLNRM